MSLENMIAENKDEINRILLEEIERKKTEFHTFNKIPRLSRECVITEKLDGTNAQILITEDKKLYAGSRNRWLIEDGVLVSDNFGFGAWVLQNKEELIEGLGIGRHFGEWWGAGIQRKYGLKEKRFSLFNTDKWSNEYVRPKCCHVVPVLYKGMFTTDRVDEWVLTLSVDGSKAAPGFMDPEGVVIYHVAAGTYFKKTIKNDESPKGKVNAE